MALFCTSTVYICVHAGVLFQDCTHYTGIVSQDGVDYTLVVYLSCLPVMSACLPVCMFVLAGMSSCHVLSCLFVFLSSCHVHQLLYFRKWGSCFFNVQKVNMPLIDTFFLVTFNKVFFQRGRGEVGARGGGGGGGLLLSILIMSIISVSVLKS